MSNPTGSLTSIKGLLIQESTLRLRSYIFRSCWRTACSGKEKVFFRPSFSLLLPWICQSQHPAFPQLSQLCSLKPFLSGLFILPQRIMLCLRILSPFSSYHLLYILSWFSLFLHISYILIHELLPSIQLSFSFYLYEISTWRSYCLNLLSLEIFWILSIKHCK